MKNRYRYALLFAISGLALAAMAAFLLFGAAAGVLWLFVLGDDPWPVWTERLLPAIVGLVFLAIWTAIMAAGYRYGQAREDGRPVPRRHLLIAAGATLLPILLLVLYQLRVGNLGPKSDSLHCSDYCRDRGYAGSGMPARDSEDRSCLCYDAAGNEVLKVPLDTFAPGR